MRLPNFRRIFTNDFEQQYKNLLDKLSGTINTGVEVLYEALNNRLTFDDNFAATVASFAVKVDSDGTPLGGANIRLSNSQKVQGILVLSAIDNTNSQAYPPGAVFVSFLQKDQSLNITNIRGLTPNVSYTIKVVALN